MKPTLSMGKWTDCLCEASKPFHALEHLFLLCRGFSAFWSAGFLTSSRPIAIFRLIFFRLVGHDRFIIIFSALSFLFVCSVFQGNHDESSALATQCETPCATRLSYHGICTILRAIGTIYVIRKGPIMHKIRTLFSSRNISMIRRLARWGGRDFAHRCSPKRNQA